MSHRLPLTLALALASLCSVATAAAEPDATEVAKRIQAFYDSTRSFQAGFKQTFQIKVQNVKKESTGQVAFVKPGKLSFRYDKPNGNRVVSDGKVIKVYEKDNQQMYQTEVKQSQYPAALAFLMGKGVLTRDFNLRKLDAAQMKMENGFVLEAVPKEASPAYKKLLLYVDGPTSQVRRVLVLDAQGNRNRFDFQHPVLNKDIADAEFVLNPPKGTTIVRP